MDHLIIPKDYHSELNLHDTQIAIKTVKDFFQNLFSAALKSVPCLGTAFRRSALRIER